ncbi:MAG: hypothetical protein AAGI44_16530 [Pseudomonadota bacterium]
MVDEVVFKKPLADSLNPDNKRGAMTVILARGRSQRSWWLRDAAWAIGYNFRFSVVESAKDEHAGQ